MATWLIILLFCFAAYGWANMVAFGSGPFRIFERLRNAAEYISPHFALLFGCMMCLPANIGWICSLVDWFFLPQIAITPFNLLLANTNLWWVAIIGDLGFTSGAVWFIHHVELFFENIAEGNSKQTELIEDESDDIIKVKDMNDE